MARTPQAAYQQQRLLELKADPEAYAAFREHKNKQARERPKPSASLEKKQRTSRNMRRKRLAKNYGVTPERYDTMRAEQNYRCAICKRHETEVRYGKLCVDHQQGTKTVRGLLCASCNAALGLLREDASLVPALLAYMQMCDRTRKGEEVSFLASLDRLPSSSSCDPCGSTD